MKRAALLGAVVLLVAACATRPPRVPELATARVAEDFGTYSLRRVGLVPLAGEVLGTDGAEAVQASFYAEISRSTPFEVVSLVEADLEETTTSDPHRRGWYRPETIIDVARRYSLDGVLFGTVTHRQFFPPQQLSVQMDLVSAETGLVIWSAEVHLDAADPVVRDGIEAWTWDAGEGPETTGAVVMLSPARFARFAAWQIAQVL